MTQALESEGRGSAREVQERDYSALAHLARALWPGSYDGTRLFGVFTSFTSYCDAAGGKDHGFIVVSGWFASVETWERFEVNWRLFLASYDVPYFHMKEYAHSTGPFEKWKGQEGTRRNFLDQAVRIIAECKALPTASIVDHATFDRVNERYALVEKFANPYVLAARTCIADVYKHLKAEGRGREYAEHIFEDGDVGQGELLRVMKEAKLPQPIFKPSRDRIGADGMTLRGIIPLQAADFPAYEIRKAMVDVGDGADPSLYRRSLRALVNSAVPPGTWGIYSEKNLIDVCENMKIPKREKDRP